jgi:hypothetical protein
VRVGQVNDKQLNCKPPIILLHRLNIEGVCCERGLRETSKIIATAPGLFVAE